MRTRIALLPLLLATTVACSGGFDQPAVSDFRSGACRAVAPSTLELGSALHELGDDEPDGGQAKELRAAQDALRAAQPAVGADLADPVQDLVTAVGLVRIRTDTHTYDPELAQSALTAYRGLVAACT